MSAKRRRTEADFIVNDSSASEDGPHSDNDGDDRDSDVNILSEEESGQAARAASQVIRPSSRRINGRGKGKDSGKAWEGQFEHTWDTVREDERGSLESAVTNLLLSSRAKRVVRDTSSIQRGIIRHVYLVLDLSLAMTVRDYKVSWLELTLQYAREFVSEFFDQNPISQMAILISRDGSAERLSSLSGNPVDHLRALSNKKKLEPRGEPSLQNCLEMGRSGMSHLPPHGSREIIVILGSLTTCDPGNIHSTITATAKDRVRVNIIGLSAEMRICRDICTQTKGSYIVAKDDLYFRDALFEFVSPPATLAPSQSHVLGGKSSSAPTSSSDLMLMGFPSLVQTKYPGLCACHSKMKTSGYRCPRCKARLCDVPTECRTCGLTVVSSPHLARSYRHLFPVSNFEVVNGPTAESSTACFSCYFPFPAPAAVNQVLSTAAHPAAGKAGPSLSPSGRYRCPKCSQHFCLDCDTLVHSALGFCPGCV